MSEQKKELNLRNKQTIGQQLSFNSNVSTPGFVTEDQEDIIRIREVPMQVDFEEGADEIITIKERSPEDSTGKPEKDEEIITIKDDDLLDPEALKREAEKDSNN